MYTAACIYEWISNKRSVYIASVHVESRRNNKGFPKREIELPTGKRRTDKKWEKKKRNRKTVRERSSSRDEMK